MATVDRAGAGLEQHDWLGLGGWLLASFAAGLSGLIFQPGVWYAQLAKPPLTPPGPLISAIWLVLYALMGGAAWLIWRGRGAAGAGTALAFFVAQLVVNALWPWLFFGLQLPLAALLALVILWLLVLGTLVLFWRLRQLAGILLLPYLAWASFAAYLNLATWWLNR